MVRVGLVRNNGATKVRVEKFGLADSYLSLRKLASNKMNVSNKKLRLFVRKGAPSLPPGTEILDDETASIALADDVVFSVSKGEEYRGPGKAASETTKKKIAKLPHPPGYPTLGQSLIQTADPTIRRVETASETKMPELNQKPAEKLMTKYFVPRLEGNLYPHLKRLLRTYPQLKLSSYPEGYFSIDYAEEMNYPPVTDWDTALLRECRGLIISAQTGKVLARRFPKFFNLDQNEESRTETIDFKGALIAPKLDGSLVSPILLDNKEIIWATRKARIPTVEHFMVAHPEWRLWIERLLQHQITPLFEWCPSDRDVGVLHYEKTQLVLLAMRHQITGEYLPWNLSENELSILPDQLPVAQPQFLGSWEETTRILETQSKIEGFVIILPSGQRYKKKAKWYLQMARAAKYGGKQHFLLEWLKENNTLKQVPASRIWSLALQNHDDTIAEVAGKLEDEEEKAHFLRFIAEVQASFPTLEKRLSDWVRMAWKQLEDVSEIQSLLAEVGWPGWIVTDLMSNRSIQEKLRPLLEKLSRASTTPPHLLSDLFDLYWDEGSARVETELEILGLAVDDGEYPKEIQRHLIESYLPKKISLLTGEPVTGPEMILHLERDYRPAEGKINGYWEEFTRHEIWDLRIDLQPRRQSGYTTHEGDNDYGLLLVQYGLVLEKRDRKPSGTLGGILVPTGQDVSLGLMQKALDFSLRYRRLVRIRRRLQLTPEWEIFCDLDGVLADFEAGVQRATQLSTKQQSVKKMWDRILGKSGFFELLPWMAGGEEFWNELCSLSPQPPTILSGLPIVCRNQVHKEKRRWCHRHLGEKIKVITCNSNEKYKKSGPGKILIDDRLELAKNWRSYGGIFIHHTSPQRTLYELRKTIGMMGKKTLRTYLEETKSYELRQPYELVDHDWPESLNHESVIGIDFEWDPTVSTKDLHLAQIATPTRVYLIPLEIPGNLDRLRDLMIKPEVLKIGFGLTGGDLQRLGSPILPVVDLQEYAIDAIHGFSIHEKPSLGELAEKVLNRSLIKSKEYQKSSWTGILTEEQERYAAIDAAVLLDLFELLPSAPPQHLYPAKAKTAMNQKQIEEFDPEQPVRVIYAGIFLTKQAKDDLFAIFSPIHPVVYSDHVTLMYAPTEYQLRGFPVGNKTTFWATACYCDKRKQVVKVKHMGKDYHITVSTAHGVPPAESNAVTKDQWVPLHQELTLTGTIGLQVETQFDPLLQLPERIREKIRHFEKTAEPGEKCKFKPGELTSIERSILHEYSETHWFETFSSGKGEKRKLTLTKQRVPKDELETIGQTGKIYKHATEKMTKKKDYRRHAKANRQYRITDAFYFSLLKIMTPNTAVPVAGTVTPSGLFWNIKKPEEFQEVDTETEPDEDEKIKNLVILRGLPGSGKSSLLRHLPKGVVCSADDYFMTKEGEYKFDASELNKAHQYCRDRAEEVMARGEKWVYIDNTNSRLSEYNVYRMIAESREYHNVFVFEIFCRDKDEAKRFALRNQHQVPSREILKMLARWETDPEALLFLSEEEKAGDEGEVTRSYDSEFRQWLSKNQLYHFKKARAKTHLLMGVGSQAPTYLDIPAERLSEFHENYAASGIDEKGEPKYLTQLVQRRTKMFYDIDSVDKIAMKPERIREIAERAYHVSAKPVYVFGCISIDALGQVKTGLHLHLPEEELELEEALTKRIAMITACSDLPSEKSWEEIIDHEVYRVGNGIRMLGSRKVTKEQDCGRLYSYYGAWTEIGWDETELSPLEQLEKSCILVSES